MVTTTHSKVRDDLETIEIRSLLEAVYQHYGYDFRNYARGSLRRRLWKRVYSERLQTISGLQERVLHDPAVMEAMLMDLSVNVTAMFRDPTFYLAMRRKVVPLLKTYPFVRIWIAGCSTGEETYSMAIMLEEEGLYERTRIYATDINQQVLERARQGTIPLERMRTFTDNYIKAGGRRSFSEYYEAHHNEARVKPSLLDNVVFAQHNLVTDRSFNEFNLIMCRNVMIYFNNELQNHVHDLFYESLVPFGLLTLGRKEAIKFTEHEDKYEELDEPERIYKRVA